MKITLDHNCVIDLAERTLTGELIKKVIADPMRQSFVVDIGASEARERGARPDRYDKFEELLAEAGIDHLPRLLPMMMWDICFWDHGIWANDAMTEQFEDIERVLFGAPLNGVPPEGFDSPTGKKWLNRVCDVASLWCHIHYKNDVFLTNDVNFMKQTKLPHLLALGARRICRPGEI